MADSLQEETNTAAREWLTDHEGEGMNPFRAMLDPLQITFRLRPSVWHPYLFWDLVADLRVPAAQDAAVARRMRDEEAELLRQRRLDGVLFSTTGSQRTASGR